MADLPTWKDLRAEFQKYADQYADRAEREPPADWAQLPQGPWTIHGGSPRSHRLFKEIAAQAIARRGVSCHKGDTEPWQLWLDLLWTEGWHCPDASSSGLAANRPGRVSSHEYKIIAEDETQRIQRIFQTSADCCADFEDRETDQSEPPVAEPIGAKSERRWSIVTGTAEQKTQKNLRERFAQVVREALAELGYRFRDPTEAIESWLDFLLKESAYSTGTAIAELGDASKHELAELKVRARESGNTALADNFGRLEAQCEFPKSLHAILRGNVCMLPEDIRLRASGGVAENASRQTGRARGRRPNHERRDAIRSAISIHGDGWRDHLGEIFKELDSKEVALGDFENKTIDLGDSQGQKVSNWADLDLATAEGRAQVIDALRKYLDPRN